MKIKSLTIQVSFVIIFALTTSLMLFGVYQLYISHSTYQQELNNDLQLTSFRLTNSLRLPLYNFDYEAVHDVIMSEMHNPSIIAVYIEEAGEKKPLAAYHRSSNGEIIKANKRISDIPSSIHAATAITYQQEKLATLYVYLTTSIMESKLNRLMLVDILQIIILDIILIVICIFFLKIKFINPLVDLTGISEKIADGNLTQPVGNYGVNEIGILAQSIEKMRNAVCDKISSLDTLNKELLLEVEERKQIALELKDSQENIRITLNSIGDAVIATNTEGIINCMNPVAETLTGWNFSECDGKPLKSFFKIINSQSRQSVIDPIKKVMEAGHVVGLADHTILIAKNGEEREIADSGAPIRNADGEIVGVVLVFRDVTEKHRLEEQLRQSQKMDSIGQLAGGVAHDFNNMLAGITGAADLMSAKLKDDLELKRYLSIIQNASEKAADLTQKLLDFSRKGKVFSIVINVHKSIQAALDILERSIDKRIKIEKAFNAKLPNVTGDPSQLQNVFLNLGVNARDAMPDGGQLTISTENITLTEDASLRTGHSILPGDYIKITVSDSGCGMKQDLITHIFEPFFTTKGVGKGTGLGLAAVYGVIKEHHGTIIVSSELNKGSSFTIYLPASAGSVQLTNIQADNILSGQGSILIVDDEEIVLETASAMLSELGYNVTLATDGKQAIQLYKEQPNSIDLVLLDLVMPEISGTDTFYELKKQNPEVKVIFSSGFTQNEGINTLLKNGAVDFIHKPYHFSDLSQKIAHALK